MAKNESSDQLVLSYELLQLMEWLVEHEAESLKKIVKRSLGRGLDKKLKELDVNAGEAFQGSIVDFLELLEILLMESSHETVVDNVIQKNLMPSIDHIDPTNMSPAMVQSSAAIATTKKEKNPSENAEKLLFEELLKRWKPKKKLSH